MNKKGFSLIEILMAMALFAIVLVSANTVMFATLKSTRKSATQTDVKTEGAYVMNLLEQKIKFAMKITDFNNQAVQCAGAVNGLGLVDTNNLFTRFDFVAGTPGVLRMNLNNITSNGVTITDCGVPIFTCSMYSVTVCFNINNATTSDVTDTNLLQFRSEVVRLNL